MNQPLARRHRLSCRQPQFVQLYIANQIIGFNSTYRPPEDRAPPSVHRRAANTQPWVSHPYGESTMEVCSPCRLQPQWTRICMKDRSRPCCSRSDLPLYAELIAGKVVSEVGDPETPRHLKSWLLGNTTSRTARGDAIPCFHGESCNLLTYQPPFLQHDVVKPQPNLPSLLTHVGQNSPFCGVGEGFTLPGCSRCNLPRQSADPIRCSFPIPGIN